MSFSLLMSNYVMVQSKHDRLFAFVFVFRYVQLVMIKIDNFLLFGSFYTELGLTIPNIA